MTAIVVTGLGVVSKLGMNINELNQALQTGCSAIEFIQDFSEQGLRSQVAALIDTQQLTPLPRKLDRYLSRAGLFAWHAAQQALEDSSNIFETYSKGRVGLMIGQMSGPSHGMVQMYRAYQTRGAARMSPFMVPQTMASSASSILSIGLGIEGISQTVAAACSSSAYAIMQACDEIRLGRHDCMIVGGVEEVPWEFAGIFDAMGALSTHYNDVPHTASRPFDQTRDGFVIAEGAAFLILEKQETAQARHAKIYGKILGYAATSDGKDMVAPSGIGAARAMKLACQQVNRPIEYINAHATGTPTGDAIEIKAIHTVFSELASQSHPPLVSSTKGLSGHLLGASGCFELIASLLMLDQGYVAGCANLNHLDDTIQSIPIPIVQKTQYMPLHCIMSNSFGFGGVNASIVIGKS